MEHCVPWGMGGAPKLTVMVSFSECLNGFRSNPGMWHIVEMNKKSCNICERVGQVQKFCSFPICKFRPLGYSSTVFFVTDSLTHCFLFSQRDMVKYEVLGLFLYLMPLILKPAQITACLCIMPDLPIGLIPCQRHSVRVFIIRIRFTVHRVQQGYASMAKRLAKRVDGSRGDRCHIANTASA